MVERKKKPKRKINVKRAENLFKKKKKDKYGIWMNNDGLEMIDAETEEINDHTLVKSELIKTYSENQNKFSRFLGNNNNLMTKEMQEVFKKQKNELEKIDDSDFEEDANNQDNKQKNELKQNVIEEETIKEVKEIIPEPVLSPKIIIKETSNPIENISNKIVLEDDDEEFEIVFEENQISEENNKKFIEDTNRVINN